MLLSDGGVGGQFVCPTGCLLRTPSPNTFDITYTAPAGAPSTITLTVTAFPHSLGFTCGPGSTSASDFKAFPVSP